MVRILILILSCALITAEPAAFAQGKSSAANGPRKHLTTIVFAGLAGAVLGLSTLSFYGRPQDRLNNIAIGAAFGIIGGTMFSTYKAAAEPREFYGLENPHDMRPRQTPALAYAFEF